MNKMLKCINIACLLTSIILFTGCNQNTPALLNNTHVSKHLQMLTAAPNFKQTTLDEIEYVRTFSTWSEAAETLGLDLAPCANDAHSVAYNVLPNYSILQTEFEVGSDVLNVIQTDNNLQNDGALIEEKEYNLSGDAPQLDIGVIDSTFVGNQSNAIESITVFLPNSKDEHNQSTTLHKLSDRISVDDSELYRYFNDFNSITSSRDIEWEHIKTVHIDSLGVDVDFCTADSTQLFAFMVYDGSLFQVSYGLVNENEVQSIVDSITESQ